MKNQPKFAFIACLILLAPPLAANAAKPTSNSEHHISDSQILPYIIDNPNSSNSVIRVRCINGRERQARRSFIRDRLLQTPNQENVYPNYITIEVEGSCRNVKIKLPNNPYPDYEPLHGDYWLYRDGSGWNWLKSH